MSAITTTIGGCGCCFGCVCWGVCNHDRTALPKKANCVPRTVTITVLSYDPAADLYAACNACLAATFVGQTYTVTWSGTKSCGSSTCGCQYIGGWVLPVPFSCDRGDGCTVFMNLSFVCTCDPSACPEDCGAPAGLNPGIKALGGYTWGFGGCQCGGLFSAFPSPSTNDPAVCDADGFVSQKVYYAGFTFLVAA